MTTETSSDKKARQDAERAIKEYRTYDLERRGNFLAARILEREDRYPDATKAFLEAVSQIWIDEGYRLTGGEGRPDPGLLKSIGYRVGVHHGKSPETRLRVICFLFTSDHLPLIKDENYMTEWGEPLSHKRHEKFVSVLNNLIQDNRHDVRFRRAVSEWQEDIEIANMLAREFTR